MKTIQNNFKYILLLIAFVASISGCKKELASESEQTKFERAMEAAGFVRVSDANVPKGIYPYELSTKEIQTFLYNPEARKDSIKQISSRNNPGLLSSLKPLTSNNKVSSILADEEDPSSFESKTFVGSKQTYYFNTVNIWVSLTFDKKKATGGGWKWVESTHTINASKISNEGDNSSNYYDSRTYTISYDGSTVAYAQEGDLYYKAFGETYKKNFPVSASGGSNGINLALTIPGP
jgi:hypothetical protein